MKRRLGLYLLCGLLLFGLTGCGGAKPETTTEDNSEEIMITDVDTTESFDSETEEPEEPEAAEILDCVPEGPEDIHYGLDNMGFYMGGETFTLPMPYSEFLEKVTTLGWSLNEGLSNFYESDGNPIYAELCFERPVENQEGPEEFRAFVINSEDITKEINLADEEIQVISFSIAMLPVPKGDGFDTYNFDSQFYLTKEIGLGRSVLNAPAVWGEASDDDNYYDGFVKYCIGDLESYPDTYIYFKSEALSETSNIYRVFEEKYGEGCKCEEVITSIELYNNPYMQ